MANPDDTESSHVEQLLDQTFEFDDDTSIHATAWNVPATDAYPDGIHYRFHFGSPDGTIIRYDNAHDGRHERHSPDGSIEPVDFPGVVELYERFLDEVAEWRSER
ncbi:toxin-antitoxin system TumE family protein [Halococcus sp. AFM35]|uniref:toxin-antitoxin system TumE family protein n=1 Tax=Halococcus sp. AFM35 TaxID=3421653 RepID=UPI003EC12E39